MIVLNHRIEKVDDFAADQWEADYRDVLSRARKANPQLRIVLLDPFVLKSGWWMTKGGQWETSRAQISKMCAIVAGLAGEFDAVHVKTQKIFDLAARAVSPEQWIWDGVHPLPQGHELIARNWLESVSA